MALDLTPADPSTVLELLEAFRRSKIMFTGVSLGVFDALKAGPVDSDSLAKRIDCDHCAMQRLLDSLVGLGLLARDGDTYANTPAADEYLTSDSPRRMTGYIHYSNRVMWPMWGNLEGAIREGTHRWQQTYGWDGPIFSSFFKDDASMREFLMGMHGFGMLTSPRIVDAIDLSRFKHLVDLGGATGHLAIAACERYPLLRATVFDLPVAVPLAREITSASSVHDRVDVVGGDFFVDDLPPADLYSLGRIVHDWSEEKIAVLLKRIYDALPSGGGLVVAEKIIADAKDGPRWAQMQDINMLIVTEGRERTLGEYEQLLNDAGFGAITACRTPMPLDIILAIKP
ncbi:MAG TPA: homocysteine methyltransferase [Planctomycetaceae bacterium]|nr:homocysteine methyltransferase [Planctomycetaceae bacterium]